jgi:hypothetical protein
MTRDLPHPLHNPNSDRTGDDLTLHAAPRTRIIDDHMFVGAEFGSEQATFRLQLFTAPGARPVAVATQLPQEGASLVNMAESSAAVVWRRHCPEEADPPLWIQRLLNGEDGQGAVFERVSFDTVGRYQLANPEWHDLTDDQIHRLVGQVMDGSRGAGYVPPEPEPEAVPVHEVTAVADLPEPHPFRTPNCMPQGGPLRRWLTVTLRAAPGCCWYLSFPRSPGEPQPPSYRVAGRWSFEPVADQGQDKKGVGALAGAPGEHWLQLPVARCVPSVRDAFDELPGALA